MKNNIFGSWSTSESSVWNAGTRILKGLISGGLCSLESTGTSKPPITPRWMFPILALGIYILIPHLTDSFAIASQEQTDLSGLSKPPFDINSIIEKAEHLPVLKEGYYMVEDSSYSAMFSPGGVIYTPVTPGGLTLDPFSLRVSQIGTSSGEIFWNQEQVIRPLQKENTLVYKRTQDIEEVYDLQSKGIEQSWVFRRNPGFSASSDLQIIMDVKTSLTGKATPQMGLEFVDGRGTPYVKYSKATIIDANGKILEVAPSWDAESSRIVLNISGGWLAEASYPVVVDPLIGANIQVDSLSAADNYPAIAFDGTNYLVVWQSGTPDVSGTGTTAIMGARVSSSGTVLDGTPLTIGDTANRDDEFPSVTYDSINSRYIVVWMMWNSTTSSNVYRNTVDAATGALGTATSILGGGLRIFSYPVVACCDMNDNYIVIYGRSSADGATDIGQYSGQTYNRPTHAAASAADPTGAATVSSGTITPDTEPRSASRVYSLSSTKYLLIWETFGVDPNGDISANLLTVTATPSYTWGAEVSVAATAPALERYPRAAFDGTNALIVYQQGATTAADIYSRFVAPSPTNLTLGTTYAVSTVAGSGQMYPDVAYTAGGCSATPISRYMVIWQDYRNNATYPDIYGSPMNTAGTVETDLAISTNTIYTKERPVIAADSGSCGYMAAWSDNRNSGTTLSDIYAQRVGYPNINNLSPASGFVGTSISINGMNFGTDPGAGSRSTATNNVKINGVQVSDADVTSWSDGVISFAVPTGTTPGTYPVTVTAESWTSNGSNLTVNTNTLQITTSSLPNGYQWITYGSNVSATGGTTPYNWTIISGALPAGLTLDSATGLISGDPSSFGTFNFSVQVTDSTTPTPQTATQALSILIYELTTIAVTPANPTLTQGQTVQFTATGTYSDNSTSNISSIVAWGSSNEAVATVNATGLATGVGLGSVTISATK